jgi:hypothetical protein
MLSKKKPNQLTAMLEDPERQLTRTYGVNGILARLFRTMLRDLKIGGYKFSLLMNQFLSDPRNNIPNNKKDQTSNRGNLNKEFQKGQMTWKVFFKALRLMRIARFKLILEVEREGGEVSFHTVPVDMASMNAMLDDMNDDDEDEDMPRIDSTKLAEDMPSIAYLDDE